MKNNLFFFGISILFILFISAESRNIGDYRPRYTISSICSHTSHKKVCRNTLRPLFKKHETSPRDVLYASTYAILKALKEAESSFDRLFNATDEAIMDCHDFMGNAYDYLHEALDIVKEIHDFPSLADKIPDVMNKISAVGAETETCLDEVGDRKAMSDVLLNSTLLCENAIAIGADTPGIFKGRSYIPIGGRRLPGDESMHQHLGVYGSRYTISSICSHTSHKKVCINTLRPLFKKHEMSPRDVLYASTYAILKALKEAESSFDRLFNATDEAIMDCHEFMGYAYDDLHEALDIVKKIHDFPSMVDKMPDVMSQLSAVGAETETCLDEVGDRKAMSDVLLNSTLLWENALAIGASTPGIFQRPSYIPIGGRRLPGNDGRGYPRWWMSKP